MRIKIEMYVDVDPAVWAEVNGFADAEGRAARVREDVRSTVFHHVQQLAMIEETDAEVTRP